MPHQKHPACPSCGCWQPDEGEITVVRSGGIEVWRTGDPPKTITTEWGPITVAFVREIDWSAPSTDTATREPS